MLASGALVYVFIVAVARGCGWITRNPLLAPRIARTLAVVVTVLASFVLVRVWQIHQADANRMIVLGFFAAFALLSGPAWLAYVTVRKLSPRRIESIAGPGLTRTSK